MAGGCFIYLREFDPQKAAEGGIHEWGVEFRHVFDAGLSTHWLYIAVWPRQYYVRRLPSRMRQPMVSDDVERALWAYTLPELVAVAALLVLVANSVFGDGTFLASVSRSLRLALLAFLAVELLIPIAIYLDMRRLPDPPDRVWIHAAAMPIVNLLGAVAYLDRRNRQLDR